MGGSAFSPTLYTPRMPPAVYTHVLTTIHTKLLTLYVHVETPIEAPAKTDYGDVDVLVYQLLPGWRGAVEDGSVIAEDSTVTASASEEKEKKSGPNENEIATLLGAKTWKRDKGSEEIHFALPWPEGFPFESETAPSSPSETTVTALSSELSALALSATADPPPATYQPAYVQLDLHICPNLQTYNWQLFRCAHGDFWAIVGSVIRQYGLSFRNDGLYLRIAEVDKVNRKGSLVLLTGETGEVLRFLFSEGDKDGGVEKVEERYWRRDAFEQVQGMCDFIRQNCTFYRPDREGYIGTADGGIVATAQPELSASNESQPQPQPLSKPQIQKKDKYGLHKRGNFRYWLEDYLPAHSPADREAGMMGIFAGMEREDVAKMVTERFGVTEEFERRKKVGLRMVGVERLWGEVKAEISASLVKKEGEKGVVEIVGGHGLGNSESKGEDGGNGQSKMKPEAAANLEANTKSAPNLQSITIEPNFVLRALRRRLSIEPRDLSMDQLDDVQRAYRDGDFEEVKQWVSSNWREVAEKRWTGSAQKSAIHYREKMGREERERATAAVLAEVEVVAATTPASAGGKTRVAVGMGVEVEAEADGEGGGAKEQGDRAVGSRSEAPTGR